MGAIILDGRKTRDNIVPKLINRVKSFSFVPKLVIIQVGDRADSTSFIRAKKLFAKKIGVDSKHIQLPHNIQQEELLNIIRECNVDTSIHGIIVQLPLPENIDRDIIIDAIDPKKDVDALTATNVSSWQSSKAGAIFPATARGIRTLLKQYDISLNGKKATVIGRSKLVGQPIAAMCSNEGAIVNVCHSKTLDLICETKEADVIIVATGKAKLIGIEHVKAGQIIIDVGINTVIGEKLDDEIEGRKLVGDVDFENVKDIVFAITPVPGGVGPMTVISLFENLLDLCDKI